MSSNKSNDERASKYGKMVSFRLNPGQENEHDDFIQLIKSRHGDYCYVMSSLERAMFAALQAAPNPEAVEIKFLHQTMQINIGCNFQYLVKKGRRVPPGPPPSIELDKNNFFPLLLDEWPTMSEKSRAYWTARLTEMGIIPPAPPSVSTAEPPRAKQKFFASLWSSVKQLFTKFRKRFKKSDVRSDSG